MERWKAHIWERKGSTSVGVIKGSIVCSLHGGLDGVAIGNEGDGLEGG